MRKVAIAVASATLMVGLSGPAWAYDSDGGRPSRFHSASNDPPGEGRSHYDRPESSGYRGENGYHSENDERPQRFQSASQDRPGEGRSHYDRQHHDDPAL